MASDNIMGPEDIIASVGIELNNIESSIAQAQTLAGEIGDWSKNTEAWGKSIADVNTILSQTSEQLEKQVEAQQELVAGQEQLRDIGAVAAQNAKNMADYYRDLSGVLNNMAGNLNIVGALGATAGFGGGGAMGSGNNGPPIMLGNPEDGLTQEEAMPSSAAGGLGGGNLFQSVMMGMTGRTRGSAAGAGKGKGPLSEEEAIAAAKFGRVKNLMNIPYYLPGGKASLAARYIDRASGGKLSNWAQNQQWITGKGDVSAAQASFEEAGGTGNYLAAKGMGASELAEAGIAGDAVAAGDAAMLSGGIMGVAAVAAPVAAVAIGAYQAYNAYATYEQQGQLLGSLTGNTNSGKMVGMEANTWFDTLFNPRLSYGAMKDIMTTGLAAGYQGNVGYGGGDYGTGLLGAYTGFAAGAYQNYGQSSQDSMAMFQAGVIQAGASATQLTDALSSLANVSATTNTSFTVLKENFTSFLNTITGLGGTGNAAVQLATANALTNANNPLLSGAGSTASMLQGTVGQALAANQMGVSYTQMYNLSQTAGGLQKEAAASNAAFLNILKNMGLYPGMPNLNEAVGSLAYALPTILTELGIQNPKKGPWTEETAVNYVIQALSNGGTGESSANGSVKSVTGLINTLTGGKSGSAGTANAVNAIASQLGGSASMVRDSSYAEVDINGNWEALNYINNLSSSQQQQVLSAMLQGQDKVRLGNSTPFSTQGSATTLGTLFKNQTLQGINNGSVTQGQMQIELGPKAAALFQLVQNPQGLSNQQIKYLASQGLSVNTGQRSGYSI